MAIRSTGKHRMEGCPGPRFEAVIAWSGGQRLDIATLQHPNGLGTLSFVILASVVCGVCVCCRMLEMYDTVGTGQVISAGPAWEGDIHLDPEGPQRQLMASVLPNNSSQERNCGQKCQERAMLRVISLQSSSKLMIRG